MSILKSALLAVERQKRIHEILEAEGVVRSADLANLLDVSVVTIRSDLKELEQKKICEMIHGGAIAIKNPIGHDLLFSDSSQTAHSLSSERERIGKYAGSLVEEGMTLIVDAGRTAVQLVDHLSSELTRVRVITPSLNVAAVASQYAHIEVIMTGGMLRNLNLMHSLVGTFAVRILRQFNADVAFLDATNWSLDAGVTTDDTADFEVKRAMVEQAKQRVLLSDSSNYGEPNSIRIANLSEFDLVVTDTKLNNNTSSAIKESGIDLVQV